MTDYIIDLSEGAAFLKVRHENLVVSRDDDKEVALPLGEIAAVILAHPQVTCTQRAVAGLVEHGGALIVCNQKNQPAGMMLPTLGHCTQTERFIAQASAALPVKKRLWQQIVRCKVAAQGELLRDLRGDDHGLTGLARSVRSGDPKNIEAQAARRYWPGLFGQDFRRRYDADDANRLLNYGYAVLRAVVGRAICASGLHPSLGLHHHNRYNAFCLADDLMEPYRPLVDAAVVEHIGQWGADAPLDKTAKRAILEALAARFRIHNEARTLFDMASMTASSLAKVFLKQGERLVYPEKLECVDT